MFASIRRYEFKSTPSAADVSKLSNQAEHEFIGKVERLPGFHGYYMCNVEGRQLLTFTLFETRAGAEESAPIAADFVKNTPLAVTLGPVDRAEGDVMLMKEAPREVGAH